jgi:hypothetical protein
MFPMNPGDPRPLIDRHAARILTRWREQLRSLPPSSALATPELLGPLMAPALARVRHESIQPALPGEVHRAAESLECRCGLNPLVALYLTGECATFDVLWAQPEALATLSPRERETLCSSLRAAWRRVAAEEIAVFCSLCRRGAELESASLARRRTAAERAPRGVFSASGRGVSPGSRGKPWATPPQSVETPG